MRLPRPHASQGLRFQENFAYGAYGPGFTEKLRMGLRGGGTTKFEHQFYQYPVMGFEHQFYERLFDKKT